MSAIVIILPTVRVERDDAAPSVVVTVDKRTFARLRNQAKHWGVPITECASMMLSDALAPPRRRR